jgi:hypothetical protein
LARVVRGRHPRTRWRPAGLFTLPEPGSAVSDDEFALLCMTAPIFFTGSFGFHYQYWEIAPETVEDCGLP